MSPHLPSMTCIDPVTIVESSDARYNTERAIWMRGFKKTWVMGREAGLANSRREVERMDRYYRASSLTENFHFLRRTITRTYYASWGDAAAVRESNEKHSGKWVGYCKVSGGELSLGRYRFWSALFSVQRLFFRIVFSFLLKPECQSFLLPFRHLNAIQEYPGSLQIKGNPTDAALGPTQRITF